MKIVIIYIKCNNQKYQNSSNSENSSRHLKKMTTTGGLGIMKRNERETNAISTTYDT